MGYMRFPGLLWLYAYRFPYDHSHMCGCCRNCGRGGDAAPAGSAAGGARHGQLFLSFREIW